jgi:hypothetical protein
MATSRLSIFARGQGFMKNKRYIFALFLLSSVSIFAVKNPNLTIVTSGPDFVESEFPEYDRFGKSEAEYDEEEQLIAALAEIFRPRIIPAQPAMAKSVPAKPAEAALARFTVPPLLMVTSPSEGSEGDVDNNVPSPDRRGRTQELNRLERGIIQTTLVDVFAALQKYKQEHYPAIVGNSFEVEPGVKYDPIIDNFYDKAVQLAINAAKTKEEKDKLATLLMYASATPDGLTPSPFLVGGNAASPRVNETPFVSER